MFSCLVNVHIIERLGLRRSMSLAAVIFAIGLTGQAFASNVPLICISRFLLGNYNSLFFADSTSIFTFESASAD